MNKRTWVAIHVVDLDGNILARKRGADGGESGIDGGMIGPPGGHCEQGESLVDAAVRELQEETGFETTCDFCTLSAIIEEPRGIVFYYRVEPDDLIGTLRHERGHGLWSWFSRDALAFHYAADLMQQGMAVFLGFDEVSGSDLAVALFSSRAESESDDVA